MKIFYSFITAYQINIPENEKTKPMSDQQNWNFEEFTTYLLLYASNSDLEITEDEVALIKKRISEEQYNRIRTAFDQTSQYQQIQTILSYKGLYFPTEDRARELIDMVKKLYNVDGHFSILERNDMRLLKKLI